MKLYNIKKLAVMMTMVMTLVMTAGCGSPKEETLETVDDMVFIGCSGLTELKFGKNLKTIGSQAFTACVKLRKVSVPKGTVIAEDAFEQCPGLDDIEYYEAD